MGIGGALLGGIIGGIIGGGPLGAIIGAGIGAYATRGKKGQGGDQQNGIPPMMGTPGSNAALMSLFRCLGKLAKSDGVVSREEADFAQGLLHELNLDKSSRTQAVNAFSEGKNSTQTFSQLVREAAMMHDRRAYPSLLEVFCIMTLADGNVSDMERAMLKDAERILGLSGQVDSFFRTRSSQSGGASSGADLSEAYKTLGISPDATDDEVKKAWRKKAVEFHPDKIQGKGLPEEFVKFANEQTRRINEAYDRISKARGM